MGGANTQSQVQTTKQINDRGISGMAAESDGANSYKRSVSPPATQETQNKKPLDLYEETERLKNNPLDLSEEIKKLQNKKPLDLSEENKKLQEIEQFFARQVRKDAPVTQEDIDKFAQQKKLEYEETERLKKPVSSYEAIYKGLK